MQSQLRAAGRPWVPSRDEALRRLAEFVPRAGRTYAAERNYDRGPGDRANVSNLSPYLRLRMLTESEVLAAVLARHSPSAAQKFVSEVFWRTYWKGWLEAHPAAWPRYRRSLDQACAACAGSAELQTRFEAAVDGRTGIDAFDAWARELVETNYLHNHARMWFASIWIFTLGLPWALGADFFMRHLLDGDPASNTLSWRWVAGLQTRGKTYAASRDNIRRYTGDRFALTRPLAPAAPPQHDDALPREPLPALPPVAPAGAPALFLIHDDDLHGDLGSLPAGLRGVCALTAVAGRSPGAVSPAVAAFTAAAAAEATARIAAAVGAAAGGVLSEDDDAGALAGTIACAAAGCGAGRVIVPFAPVGPVRARLAALRPALAARGLPLDTAARRYDAAAWPAATGGFFGLRARIPTILAELQIAAG